MFILLRWFCKDSSHPCYLFYLPCSFYYIFFLISYMQCSFYYIFVLISYMQCCFSYIFVLISYMQCSFSYIFGLISYMQCSIFYIFVLISYMQCSFFYISVSFSYMQCKFFYHIFGPIFIENKQTIQKGQFNFKSALFIFRWITSPWFSLDFLSKNNLRTISKLSSEVICIHYIHSFSNSVFTLVSLYFWILCPFSFHCSPLQRLGIQRWYFSGWARAGRSFPCINAKFDLK